MPVLIIEALAAIAEGIEAIGTTVAAGAAIAGVSVIAYKVGTGVINGVKHLVSLLLGSVLTNAKIGNSTKSSSGGVDMYIIENAMRMAMITAEVINVSQYVIDASKKLTAEESKGTSTTNQTTAIPRSEDSYIETFPTIEQEGTKIYDTPAAEQKGPEVLVFPKEDLPPEILIFPDENLAKPKIESFPAERPNELGGNIYWSKSKNKGKSQSSENNGPSNKEKMIGEKGTKVISDTTWQNGKTERIDVENPSPGKRPGQIHYHEPNNEKWYFDIVKKIFYNPKTGELAPKRIQKLLNDTDFVNGINKALKLLGEDILN